MHTINRCAICGKQLLQGDKVKANLAVVGEAHSWTDSVTLVMTPTDGVTRVHDECNND